VIQGLLFSEHFLKQGIREFPEYRTLEADGGGQLAAALAAINAIAAAFPRERKPPPVEAQTEADLILPILAVLGWDRDRVIAQQRANRRGRTDVPDLLLCATPEAKRAAGGEGGAAAYRHGILIVESKRWMRPLDHSASAARTEDDEVPSTQILRYLSRVETHSERAIQWGVLTNGRQWRLYHQGAKSRSEEFLEIDLLPLLDLPDAADLLRPDAAERAHWLRVFWLLFGRDSFRGDFGGYGSLHAKALDEGRRWEAAIAKDLSSLVFSTLFADLVRALHDADDRRPAVVTPAYLAELKQAALLLLYRILFLLYAEDRDLLPSRDRRYDDYSLNRIRNDIAARIDGGDAFSSSSRRFWSQLVDLCRIVDRGEDSLGIPAYNGGLFNTAAAPLLERVELSDKAFVPLLDGLSRRLEGGQRRRINYRDLSVQQLGSIYERLLEFELEVTDAGIAVVGDDAERHGTGSYYTPEPLVQLILDHAVGPLLAGHDAAFTAAAERLAKDRRPRGERLAELARLDPAVLALDLKICDPAMGSGHFLVSLVDYLADRVLLAMSAAPLQVSFTEPDVPYVSPLVQRIAGIRTRILALAEQHGWAIEPAQLDDRRLIRRMILKRVVHGVDKNPMAVELAKVALWLHTFTVGAPLSFLDHHLRCGDSLLGAWVAPTQDWLEARGALLGNRYLAAAQASAQPMNELERITDADLLEVESSRQHFAAVAEAVAPLTVLFDLIRAEKLMGIFAAAPTRRPKDPTEMRQLGASAKAVARAETALAAHQRSAAFKSLLDGTLGDPIALASGASRIAADATRQLHLLAEEPSAQTDLLPTDGGAQRDRRLAQELVDQARALARRERFLHWEVAFPNVWRDWGSREPAGGFDAVIGNPPYVRQEKLAQIKPALQDFATYDGAADLYVYFYDLGLRLLKPGGRLSYVVTNKWFKAGYAEKLRGLFAERAWLDLVVDFGHAKGFFPDADVFPSVIVARRPDGGPPPASTQVCLVPRDLVRYEDLLPQVAAASFPLPRAAFTRESWVLEPPEVLALLDKIGRAGVPLAEYAGVKPLYGIKTGLNEAFLIEQATRDRLVREDPRLAEIIRPFLRGQDIQRWYSPPSGLHMIVMKSSGDHPWPWADAGDGAEALFRATYPALHAHFKPLEEKLRKREDQGRHWWELRACAYYDLFQRTKIIYNDITWSAQFNIDLNGNFLINTTYFLASTDNWLALVLNAPVGWWYSWRKAQHGKDEALRYFTSFVENYPVPAKARTLAVETETLAKQLHSACGEYDNHGKALRDWYRNEFGLDRLPGKLLEPFGMDRDEFAAAVRSAMGRRTILSSTAVQAIHREHDLRVVPMGTIRSQVVRLESQLSDLVNAAYGLTPDEVALMWRTAPPRMPIAPPAGVG